MCIHECVGMCLCMCMYACAYISVCMCLGMCIQVCACVCKAHGWPLVLSWVLPFYVASPWSEAIGSYLYMGKLVQGIPLFAKSFSKHCLSKLNPILCVRVTLHSKKGCGEFFVMNLSLDLHSLGFLIKGPSVPLESLPENSCPPWKTDGLILPECYSRATDLEGGQHTDQSRSLKPKQALPVIDSMTSGSY